MNVKWLLLDFSPALIYLMMVFRLVSTAAIICLTAACQMGSRQSDDLYKQAEQALSRTPERVLALTDSAMKGSGGGRLSTKQTVSIIPTAPAVPGDW
jgi:NADH:ubiquinone oxidoreductase subunit F (NADH-binding)